MSFIKRIYIIHFYFYITEVQLIPEPIFTVTTDGVGITTIANTSSGRIFLGSRNGSLYEIYYQVGHLKF